jgi:hypothetical protein
MFSKQPGGVDQPVSPEVSHLSGGDECCLVSQQMKFAEIEKSLAELRSGRMIVIAETFIHLV